MQKRELVQLSHTYKKQHVGGWYESPKLDGFRVTWDGGVTRGIPKIDVPWANNDKDERYLVPPIATGLWSRYGNVVHAPNWFLDGLPKGIVLDGEMFNPLMSRQKVRSVCAKLYPEGEWNKIQYHVFNRLSPATWLQPGRINNPQFKEKILRPEVYDWYLAQGGQEFGQYSNMQIYEHLVGRDYWHDHLHLVEQNILPRQDFEAVLQSRLLEEMDKPFGEGLILTDPMAFTDVKRVSHSLKVKPRDDSEATVIGYITGRVGKLQGLMGSVIVDWQGKRLELSGFTNAERHITDPDWAYVNVEAELPRGIMCPAFPRGHTIGFTYRGLTDDGIPNEAVYCRKEGCYN